MRELGLRPIFNTPYLGHSRSSKDENRTRVKKGLLILLEDYSPVGPQFMEFLRHEIERTPALGKTDDPSWNLETRIYQSISQDASDRLKLIRERVSREAMALAPGYEERKILADINRVLARHSIEQMTIADILQMDNLPPHAQRSPKDLYTVRAMLVLYLQRLNGEVFRAPNSGLKGSYPVKNIRAQFSNYINPGALDVLRKLGVYGPSAIKRWKKK